MDLFNKYQNDINYVYKSCGLYIVVLEKLTDTITNEYLNCNPYAKYRGNKFLVKDIIHKFDKNVKNDHIMYSYCCNRMILYKIGKIVMSDNYYYFDCLKELDTTRCIHEITYFLKIERAYYHSLEKIKNGEYLKWNDSGQLIVKCTYVNGFLNGKYLEWYNSGQKRISCNYIGSGLLNGLLNGEYLEWYPVSDSTECEQLKIQCTYTNGLFVGTYLRWYKSGQIHSKRTYDTKGILNGEYLEWFNNGTLHYQMYYVNNKLNGNVFVYYPNNNLYIKCSYSNDKLHGEYCEWSENCNLVGKYTYVNGNKKWQLFKIPIY